MLSARSVIILIITVAAHAEDEVETETEATTTGTSEQSFIAYDFLYNEGVSMYLQDNWEECVKNLELALKGWHYSNDNIARYEHQML